MKQIDRVSLASAALFVVASLLACKSGSEQKKDGDSAAASATAAEASKKIAQPKVKLTPISLEGKCNDSYPIEKDASGKPIECAITEDIPAGDITCAKDGRPSLFDDGTVKNCGLKGVVEMGDLKCHKGITFFKGGAVKTCFLAEPVTNDGEECKIYIQFLENGEVEKCVSK